MSSSAAEARTILATDVTFDTARMHVALSDGRAISIPLTWFPRLHQATAQQRQQWEFIGQGIGISWPELDEDLSVAGLLAGNRSRA